MNRIPILLYHAILPREDDLSKYSPEEQVYLVKEEEFTRQLEYLHSEGWSTISVNQLLEFYKEKTPFPARALIISFDDGYQSDYTIALPRLKESGFKATFFVTGDFIDTAGYLNKSQIMQMSQEGMEIGSHGKTHKFLSTLKEDELRIELRDSKNKLEKIIGKEVNLLSLPGGYRSSKVKIMARELGYKGICTSKFGWNEQDTSAFELKRISLRYGDSLSYFVSLVNEDKRICLQRKLKDNSLSIVKTFLGPDNYFRLWSLYRRIFK